MKAFERCASEGGRADRSADFIYRFALGLPKTLATVKAASDHFDGSTRPVTNAPLKAPVRIYPMAKAAFS